MVVSVPENNIVLYRHTTLNEGDKFTVNYNICMGFITKLSDPFKNGCLNVGLYITIRSKPSVLNISDI